MYSLDNLHILCLVVMAGVSVFVCTKTSMYTIFQKCRRNFWKIVCFFSFFNKDARYIDKCATYVQNKKNPI